MLLKMEPSKFIVGTSLESLPMFSEWALWDHCCVEPLGILREGSELLQLLSQAVFFLLTNLPFILVKP